jgi:hypothetical protein
MYILETNAAATNDTTMDDHPTIDQDDKCGGTTIGFPNDRIIVHNNNNNNNKKILILITMGVHLDRHERSG